MGLLSPSPIKIETFVLGAVVSLITIAIVPLFNLAGQLIGMSITLSEKYIAGPSLWVNQPVRFSLKDLDKEKSSRQSFFQRLFGYRLIVSTSGQKILFVERAFDKKPAADILKTIGDADKIAA
ncbi:MAG TPA: hypothetical protein VMP08_26635 [Anaerolineae bacterium]|nr:hypothetical protein [Anaerolineae bacterium]